MEVGQVDCASLSTITNLDCDTIEDMLWQTEHKCSSIALDSQSSNLLEFMPGVPDSVARQNRTFDRLVR